MKRLAVIVLLALFALSLAAVSAPIAEAHSTWTVIAGGGTRDVSVVANAFFPRTIEVTVGDTVTWKFQGFHNVVFLGGEQPPSLEVQEGNKTYFNPRVFFPGGGKTYDGTGYHNSGVPPDDPQAAAKFAYPLTFTKAGSYPYVCLIHGPAMAGTVAVKDRVIGSPASVARQARSEQTAAIRAGQKAWAAWKTEREGATVVVPMIGDPKAGFSIFRFSRQPLVIPVGTTVKWVMRDPFEIHTVTFWGTGKPPAFVIPEPQPQGPPKLLVNPQVAAPTPHKTYDGTGYVNSGILYPPGTPPDLPKSYSLTFTQPGKYVYVCVVHAFEGMYGTIIVK